MSVIGDNKLRLDFGTSASVIINLIMGKPPEWLALIPKGEPILQSQIFAPQLEAAAKRVRTSPGKAVVSSAWNLPMAG